MKKAKDPFLALSRFLVAATLVSVLINLNLPTAQSEGIMRLIEVLPQYKPNFISIYLYLFFSAVLVILYSTKAGRTKWGARSTGILVFANILLFFYYWAYVLNIPINEPPQLIAGYAIFSVFFIVSSAIPQSYWAFYFGKIRMYTGIGWEQRQKKGLKLPEA